MTEGGCCWSAEPPWARVGGAAIVAASRTKNTTTLFISFGRSLSCEESTKILLFCGQRSHRQVPMGRRLQLLQSRSSSGSQYLLYPWFHCWQHCTLSAVQIFGHASRDTRRLHKQPHLCQNLSTKSPQVWRRKRGIVRWVQIQVPRPLLVLIVEETRY